VSIYTAHSQKISLMHWSTWRDFVYTSHFFPGTLKNMPLRLIH